MLLSDDGQFCVRVEDGRLILHHCSGAQLVSPPEGYWSVAADYRDGTPADWRHGVIDEVVTEAAGNWLLSGKVQLPNGECRCKDHLRFLDNGLLEIRRSWSYCGAVQNRVTLSYRFQQPGGWAEILMPGILYCGNPSGARSGKVPVLSKHTGSKGFFEEHRYPMPWVMAENPENFLAVLHSIPSEVPAASRSDLWWTLGCEYLVNCTELAGYSGFTAINGLNGYVKSGQNRLELLEHNGMTLTESTTVEKIFYIQLDQSAAPGQGVIEAVDKALKLWPAEKLPVDPGAVVKSKYDYAVKYRYYQHGKTAGALFNTPENGIAEIVFGWCGRSEVMGFAASVIGHKCGDIEAERRSEACWDFMTSSPIDENGFFVRCELASQRWLEQDFISQGQALAMLGRDLLERKKRKKLIKKQWLDFLLQVCDCSIKRIEKESWHPKSTCEAFFALPLAYAYELSGNERLRSGVLRIADHYIQRHLSMREPYWGGTLDASCEDKEAAAAAMEAFFAAWNLTHRECYLQAAKHASSVCLTYLQCWQIPMPPGSLAEQQFNSVGWTAVSVQNMHLDVYGVWIAPLLWQIADALQNDLWKLWAKVMFINCGQLINEQGSQGEQIQQTNFSQSAQYNELAVMRGGYVASWQVFWITAAFLSSAAEFELLGESLFAAQKI